MMKNLLKIFILLLVACICLMSFTETGKRIFGYFTQRQLAGAITQWYLSDSPGNSVGNSKLVVETKDSTYYDFYFENIGLRKYGSSRSDGTPTSVIWADANGILKRSPFPTIPTNNNQLTNGAGYITSVPAQSWASITGKPSFATVATTGDYNDLINKPVAPTKTYVYSPSRTIQTVAAAANGFQVSASKESQVTYSVSISCAVQIGLVTNVEGYVVLEIAPTNSSTASDWKEVSRISASQNISLAVALASTQKSGGAVTGFVPAGYYARLRSVNVSGTPVFAYNSGMEVY